MSKLQCNRHHMFEPYVTCNFVKCTILLHNIHYCIYLIQMPLKYGKRSFNVPGRITNQECRYQLLKLYSNTKHKLDKNSVHFCSVGN